jgi:hypothetical protein
MHPKNILIWILYFLLLISIPSIGFCDETPDEAIGKHNKTSEIKPKDAESHNNDGKFSDLIGYLKRSTKIFINYIFRAIYFESEEVMAFL